MKTKTVTLPSGVIEIRTYDSSGRLTDIRRKQPPTKIDRPAALFTRTPSRHNRDSH